jgi:SNF2 family DNA or RNA helicase
MDQAADRCHRIGQTDSVTAWNMIVAGTIDEDIAALIAAKREIVDAATDGDSSDPDSTSRSILGDLLIRLTEKGLRHD